MFTTIGWSESQDSGGVLVYAAGLSDPHVRVSGDDISVPSEMPFLLGVWAGGITITLAQLESPSLRRVALLDICPVNIGVEPISPLPIHKLFSNPIELVPYESMRALVAEGVAGAEQETVIAWLGDGPQLPVSGEMFTIRATATAPAGAYAWGNAALTFSQSLPAGRYQVVGMRATSTSMIAARLVFVGSPWRPGCIGFDTISEVNDPIFRMGNLGVWGEFDHTTPPTVDFLSVSGGEASVVHLDLIKIR